MKKIILSLTLLLFISPAFATETICTQPQSIAVVDGMVCDFCAQGLIKTFKKNENVSDVKIDLTTKKVTILMKPGTSIEDTEIAKNIDYSGYKLVSIDHACNKKS